MRNAPRWKSVPASPPPAAGMLLQVTHTLHLGGAELLAERFARRLGGPQKVAFACLDDLGPLGESLRADGFRVEVIGRRQGLDYGCARRLHAFARAVGANAIHAHQCTPFTYAALGRWPGRRPPLMFTEHGRFFPDLPSRKRMFLNRLLLRRGDRVLAVGECVKRALVANEGFAAERIDVVLNGVDLSKATAFAPQRDAVRAELGLAPHEFAALIVARLDPIKNHAMLLDAVRIGLADLPAKLVIVGDGPERASVEAAIAGNGLGDRVLMLGSRRDVPRLLAAADAVALSSVSEGIPLSLIEAMAARLPVVATACGGMPEVVVPGETGLLAPSGDAPAFGAALRQLALNPELRRRLGAAGRLRAERLFDENAMLARYEAILAELRK